MLYCELSGLTLNPAIAQPLTDFAIDKLDALNLQKLNQYDTEMPSIHETPSECMFMSKRFTFNFLYSFSFSNLKNDEVDSIPLYLESTYYLKLYQLSQFYFVF